MFGGGGGGAVWTLGGMFVGKWALRGAALSNGCLGPSPHPTQQNLVEIYFNWGHSRVQQDGPDSGVDPHCPLHPALLPRKSMHQCTPHILFCASLVNLLLQLHRVFPRRAFGTFCRVPQSTKSKSSVSTRLRRGCSFAQSRSNTEVTPAKRTSWSSAFRHSYFVVEKGGGGACTCHGTKQFYLGGWTGVHSVTDNCPTAYGPSGLAKEMVRPVLAVNRQQISVDYRTRLELPTVSQPPTRMSALLAPKQKKSTRDTQKSFGIHDGHTTKFWDAHPWHNTPCVPDFCPIATQTHLVSYCGHKVLSYSRPWPLQTSENALGNIYRLQVDWATRCCSRCCRVAVWQRKRAVVVNTCNKELNLVSIER